MTEKEEKTIIKFDRWWEKLTDRRVGDLFTTIRTYSITKDEFYSKQRNNIFGIEVTDTKNGFKGFKEFRTYLILLLEVTKVDENNRVKKAKLLQTFVENNEEITESMKEYDTRE